MQREIDSVAELISSTEEGVEDRVSCSEQQDNGAVLEELMTEFHRHEVI